MSLADDHTSGVKHSGIRISSHHNIIIDAFFAMNFALIPCEQNQITRTDSSICNINQ